MLATVAILSGLGTILLLEGLLAVFHPVPFSIERNMYFVADPYTGYRLAPHGHGWFGNGIPADVNANGHRDVETPVARRDGVSRILVLGDSFTVGADVRQEEAYPKVLERLLNARSARPVEVVNAGVGGWEPFMYVQYYDYYGRQFHPDLVLVGFFVGNDAYNQFTRVEELPTALQGRRVSRAAATLGPAASALVFLTEHFNLARLVLLKGPALADRSRTRCDDFSEDYLAIQRDRMSNHLERDERQLALGKNALRQISRLQALLAADQIPLLVVFLPDENQINPALRRLLIPTDQLDAYDFAMPQAMLAETFGTAGIRTLDLLPAFLANSRCLYNNDTHWTPDGHALAAALIADQIGVASWTGRN